MTIKWLTVVLVGFSLIMSPLAPADNLVDVYQLAETKDPELLAIIASHQATLEQYPQARAQLLPSLRFRTEVARNFQDVTLASGSAGFGGGKFQFTGEAYTLSLTQPVFRYDRWVQLHQAGTRIQQAAAEVDSARQDLGVRVSERYFDVLAAQDELVFSRAAKNALQRQLDQTNLRFEVGIIAITDVQEAQAGYDLAVAQEILALNQIDNAHDALREITGTYHKKLSALTKDIPLLVRSISCTRRPRAKMTGDDRKRLEMTGIRHDLVTLVSVVHIHRKIGGCSDSYRNDSPRSCFWSSRCR